MFDLKLGSVEPYAFNTNQAKKGADNMPFEPLKNYKLDFFTIPQSCKQDIEGT